MNKTYTLYDLNSGLIHGIINVPDALLSINVPPGSGCIEGEFSAKKFRIVDGRPESYEPPPTSEFALAERARAQRDALLKACDWVVTKAIERSEPIPAPWLSYRQNLRDITTQAGFPRQIDWPQPPQ